MFCCKKEQHNLPFLILLFGRQKGNAIEKSSSKAWFVLHLFPHCHYLPNNADTNYCLWTTALNNPHSWLLVCSNFLWKLVHQLGNGTLFKNVISDILWLKILYKAVNYQTTLHWECDYVLLLHTIYLFLHCFQHFKQIS